MLFRKRDCTPSWIVITLAVVTILEMVLWALLKS